MEKNTPQIILYHSEDGKAAVSLYAQDGSVWLNQNQLTELFATSKPNISMHIRLKNPDGRPDYFDELLARIRDIRASEKRFYQKIKDLFALSNDYDKTDKST